MKHIHFDPESDGFYEAYWLCEGADCAVSTMIYAHGIWKDIEKRMRRVLAEWKGEK